MRQQQTVNNSVLEIGNAYKYLHRNSIDFISNKKRSQAIGSRKISREHIQPIPKAHNTLTAQKTRCRTARIIPV